MVINKVLKMVTEYISQSLDAYKKNFWQIVGGLILILFISIGIIIVSGLPLLASFIQYYSGISSPTAATFANFILGSGAQTAVFVAGIIAASLASFALNAGYVKMLADALKGKAEINTIFSVARKKFWTIIGANIIAGLIVLALALVLLAPPVISVASALSAVSNGSATLAVLGSLSWFFAGLIIFVLAVLPFTLVEQAVVIGNYNAVDSVKKSFSVVKENYLQLLLLIIILVVISFIVSLVPAVGDLIGIFVVTPLTLLSYTVFYLAKTKKSKLK
jgi:hypothetical protein